jgi:hypothetical protein
VTVPPQTTQPATAGSTTGGSTVTTTGRHRKHKNAVANSDSQPKTPVQTGPITTGVEPSTCDANADGAADPGSPSSCGTTDGAASTGAVEPTTVTATTYAAPTKVKAAPKKKSGSKKRVGRR